MRGLRRAGQVAAAIILLLVACGPAAAQATRTWVSGVGDDANPCSRTAPGKTFAGAISKTAAGGEINVLDAGGFGAVTITKSITIDGGESFASVLASFTNGIIINAGPNDVVTLRNLSIQGAGNGLNGIRFLAGGALNIENCVIANFTGRGIDIEPSGNARFSIKDTIVRNCAVGAVFIAPLAAGSAQVTVDGARLETSSFGVRAEDRTTISVRNSLVSGNANVGLVAAATAAPVVMNLESCMVNHNIATATTHGIRSSGTQATVRISNVTVVGNAMGLVSVGGGAIVSFRNNTIAGNTTDGTPTVSLAQQ